MNLSCFLENKPKSYLVRVAFLYALPMVQKILTTAGADGAAAGMKSPHESRLMNDNSNQIHETLTKLQQIQDQATSVFTAFSLVI